MKIFIHEPLCVATAAKLAVRFSREYPAPHKDCIYVGGGIATHIRRTKAGNLTIHQWDDPSYD